MTISWNRALSGCVVAIFVAALSSGCGDKPSGSDAGTPVVDSGPSTDDGGPDDTDGGTPDGDGGTVDPGIGETGSVCHSDADCASLICLSSGVCSLPCEGSNNCPNSSWQCGQEGSRTGICVCAKTEGGDDICDGIDNDCNGVIDDIGTAVCPGLRTCFEGDCFCAPENSCGDECVDKQTNPKHCNECGHACGEGSVCEAANCVCKGQICGNDVCVDTTSDNRFCGSCDNACGLSDDCVSSQCVPADREWTRWPVVAGFMQSSMNGEVTDNDTHLVWREAYEAHTQQDAATYCASFGSEWRVPTRAELLSIVDFDRVLGTGFAAISPGFNLPTSGPGPNPLPFWTSTVVADGAGDRYWAVNFVDGRLSSVLATNIYFVRCVRQGL